MNAFFCVTDDNYVDLAEVLVKSIRENGHTEDIIVGHGKGLNKKNQLKLKTFGAKTINFPVVNCPYCRPSQKRWNGSNLLKLHAFGLEKYDKILVMDADCMLHDNVSEVFEREERYLFAKSATQETDVFSINSGVMMITPNRALYTELIKIASLRGTNKATWSSMDETILRAKFSDLSICKDWRNEHNIQKHADGVGLMGREYNVYYTKEEVLSNLPIIEKEKVKIVHFLNWGYSLHKPNRLSRDIFKLWTSSSFPIILEYYKKYYQLKDSNP